MRKEIISAKIDILATFVRIVGVTTIISGIFLVIAEIILGADILSEALTAIVTIIIGLIIIFITTHEIIFHTWKDITQLH